MDDIEDTSRVNLQSNPKHILHTAAAKLTGKMFHSLVEHIISRGSENLLHGKTEDGITVIHAACYFLEDLLEDTLKLFAANKLDFNARDEAGITPLMLAVRAPINIPIMKALIQLGADCNMTTKFNHTALFKAVLEGNVEAVRFLVEEGCDINLKSVTSSSPLHTAALRDELDVVRELVQLGADINSTNLNGRTALHILLMKPENDVEVEPNDIFETVKFLISHGANVNLKDVEGATMLHLAPTSLTPELYHELVLHLIQIGNAACLQILDDMDSNPLHRVASSDLEVLEATIDLFVSHGVDLAAVVDIGASLIHLAAMQGNLHFLEILLTRKTFDVNTKTNDGLTPLHTVFSGNKNTNIHEIVKKLLEHGANAKSKSKTGLTPPHLAMLQEVKWETVQLLLEHGADVNAKNEDNDSVLFYAVCFQPMDVVNRLIKNGADITCKNDHGNNMVHGAVTSEEIDKVEMFLSMGCDINAIDGDGDTPLHYAFEFGKDDHYKIAEMLIRKGADVNVVTFREETTLDWYLRAYKKAAEVFKSGNLLKLMVEHGCDMNKRNMLGTPMLQVLASHVTPKIFHELLAYLAETGKTTWLRERGHFGETLLHRAVQNIEMEEGTLQLFRSQGVDFNAKDMLGNSVIFYAILGGRTARFLNMLISFGCNVNARNGMKDTALHYAALTGNSLVVFAIVTSSEVDVNARNLEGRTSLHMVPQGCDQCIELLIDEGADATLLDLYGRKPKIWN